MITLLGGACSCRKSPKLNTALALSGLTALLVSRLEQGDAVAKLTLLKIIKVSPTTALGRGRQEQLLAKVQICQIIRSGPDFS
jgi:hypothetical protein